MDNLLPGCAGYQSYWGPSIRLGAVIQLQEAASQTRACTSGLLRQPNLSYISKAGRVTSGRAGFAQAHESGEGRRLNHADVRL